MNNEVKIKLQKYLNKRLVGNWIRNNSAYEEGLCEEIGWEVSLNRYFDALCENLKIEIKKGHSIWLDLLRYAEIAAEVTDEQDTITAFFVPSKTRDCISDVYVVETKDIINWLGLTKENSKQILNIPRPPRGLNIQASMTLKDVKSLAVIHKILN